MANSDSSTRGYKDAETRRTSPRLRVSASSRQWIFLALVLLIAASFRFTGLAWDGGYLFHPDERKILLVVNELALPENFAQAFSPDSPLSPKFFAYGSFPIYILKALSAFAPVTDFAVPWRDNQLVGLAILGRALSAIFDLGAIVFTFLLARILYDARVGLIASACIAVTVLHIQLAHFYAVDTLLTMLVVATMYFAARYAASKNRRDEIAMAIAFGLALATKISAAPLVVPIVVAVIRVDAATRRHGDAEKIASPRHSSRLVRPNSRRAQTDRENPRARVRDFFHHTTVHPARSDSRIRTNRYRNVCRARLVGLSVHAAIRGHASVHLSNRAKHDLGNERAARRVRVDRERDFFLAVVPKP
jgi:hypothetical protein